MVCLRAREELLAQQREIDAEVRDTQAKERDHATDQRDHAADERDHAADERDERPAARARIARQRELAISQREAAADERDRMAERRQALADERERLADQREIDWEMHASRERGYGQRQSKPKQASADSNDCPNAHPPGNARGRRGRALAVGTARGLLSRVSCGRLEPEHRPVRDRIRIEFTTGSQPPLSTVLGSAAAGFRTTRSGP